MYAPVILALGLLLCMAIGEIIANLTRARIPSLLISMGLYLAAVWSGLLSQEAVNEHILIAAGNLLTGVLIMHLGTMMPMSTVKVQYKYVLVALAGMIGAVVLVVGVGSLIIGYHASVAGAGPVAGGFIATLISTNKLTEIGQSALVPIPALILALQQLIGLPLAIVFLRRYAKTWVARRSAESSRTQQLVDAATATGGTGEAARDIDSVEDGGRTATAEDEGPAPLLPMRLYSPAVVLLLLLAGTLAATWIGEQTGVSYTLWCLILGFALRGLRVLPSRSLDQAGSFGFATVTVTLVVIVAVGSITPANLISALVPTLVILILGPLGIALGGLVTARILGLDRNLATPVALTALFGFPGDFIICQEVAEGVARNEAERDALLNHIFPPLLIGGFTTVTTGSVVVASVLVSTL
ncbi:hypothetical protein SAMN04489752_0315 [Brevibacterium siliguriense]|uniref:Uncharacterized protein n=1 Tax=Brevibacterium siliguriense TaxID=1136497 RepID=A0A1H1M1Z2_9MICO|nr:hypothetical protein [Brevibacterium siliguriense]SDR80670.1 hypothetical protein SAMN04489752_0315 [Brevibacterium siliguriense]